MHCSLCQNCGTTWKLRRRTRGCYYYLFVNDKNTNWYSHGERRRPHRRAQEEGLPQPQGQPQGTPPPGAGSGGKGGKVSDLAGGLATKLNMNAMLAGGTGAPPGAGGGGGKVRPQLAASAGGSGSSGDGSTLAHLANGRPTIPRGRRRPRGAR